jgi:hypothetical protein
MNEKPLCYNNGRTVALPECNACSQVVCDRLYVATLHYSALFPPQNPQEIRGWEKSRIWQVGESRSPKCKVDFSVVCAWMTKIVARAVRCLPVKLEHNYGIV